MYTSFLFKYAPGCLINFWIYRVGAYSRTPSRFSLDFQPHVFVYVIGLHAVQFVNNWMKKLRGQPNCQSKIFIQLLQIGQSCSPLTY